MMYRINVSIVSFCSFNLTWNSFTNFRKIFNSWEIDDRLVTILLSIFNLKFYSQTNFCLHTYWESPIVVLNLWNYWFFLYKILFWRIVSRFWLTLFRFAEMNILLPMVVPDIFLLVMINDLFVAIKLWSVVGGLSMMWEFGVQPQCLRCVYQLEVLWQLYLIYCYNRLTCSWKFWITTYFSNN